MMIEENGFRFIAQSLFFDMSNRLRKFKMFLLIVMNIALIIINYYVMNELFNFNIQIMNFYLFIIT